MPKYIQMHNLRLPTCMASFTKTPELIRSDIKNFLKILKGILQSIIQIGKPLTFTELSIRFRKVLIKLQNEQRRNWF